MRRTLIAVAAGIAAVTLLSAGPAAAEDNSSFVSQSVPASVRVGIRVAVSLTFRNTGTTSWTPAGGYVLGSPNPANSATWEVSSVALPSAVAPGSSVTFNFNVSAPSTPGTYNFQWQLQTGTRFFGATSTNVSVAVAARPAASITNPTSAATFASLEALQQQAFQVLPLRVRHQHRMVGAGAEPPTHHAVDAGIDHRTGDDLLEQVHVDRAGA